MMLESEKKDKKIAIFTTLFVSIASGLEASKNAKRAGEWCVTASEKVVNLPVPTSVKNALLIVLLVVAVFMPALVLIAGMNSSFKLVMGANTTDEYQACLDKRKEWKPIKLVYDTFAPTIKKAIKRFQSIVNNIYHVFFTIRSFLLGIIKTCFNYACGFLRFTATEAKKCALSLAHAIYGLNVVQNVKHVMYIVITKAISFDNVKRQYDAFLPGKYFIAYKYFLVWFYHFRVAKQKVKRITLLIQKHIFPTKGAAHL